MCYKHFKEKVVFNGVDIERKIVKGATFIKTLECVAEFE